MFSQEQLTEIVRRHIESQEKLGYQAGGSDHSAYVSYEIRKIETFPLDARKVRIRYEYVLFVETEFTYYPDNPPMEYEKSQEIIVDEKGQIVKSEQSE